MAEPIYYDVFTYHDVSTESPIRLGERLPLDGEEWYVHRIGPPVHDGKAAAVYCKLAPLDRAPFPSDWPEQPGD
jgi:hypothetical protein